MLNDSEYLSFDGKNVSSQYQILTVANDLTLEGFYPSITDLNHHQLYHHPQTHVNAQ